MRPDGGFSLRPVSGRGEVRHNANRVIGESGVSVRYTGFRGIREGLACGFVIV